MEEGHFDAQGMYHWNKEENIRDNWLENIDWVQVSTDKLSIFLFIVYDIRSHW